MNARPSNPNFRNASLFGEIHRIWASSSGLDKEGIYKSVLSAILRYPSPTPEQDLELIRATHEALQNYPGDEALAKILPIFTLKPEYQYQTEVFDRLFGPDKELKNHLVKVQTLLSEARDEIDNSQFPDVYEDIDSALDNIGFLLGFSQAYQDYLEEINH